MVKRKFGPSIARLLLVSSLLLMQTASSDSSIIPTLSLLLGDDTKTFSDSDSGVAFDYPVFGSDSVANINVVSDGLSIIDVNYKSTINDQSIGTFGVVLVKNEGGLTLGDWFSTNIDVGGWLQLAGTFQQEVLRNGMTVLVLTAPVPEEHTDPYGPVSHFYGIFPSGSTIVSAALSQAHELDIFGYTSPGSQEELLREILASMRFE